MLRTVRTGAAIAASLMVTAFVAAADEPKGDPYTLKVCAVAGEELGTMGEPVVVTFEGREFRLCCSGCKARLENESAKYIAKVDEQMIADQQKHYPLDTDLVSGESLGGKPLDVIYKNRLVRFSSEASKEKFMSDPGQYLAKLNKAVIDKQKGAYPLKTCVISGEELGSMGEPIHLVIANRLISLCCGSCEEGVTKDPLAAISKVDKKG